MDRPEKTLLKILSGFSDKNISFKDLYSVLAYLGFEEKIKGGHHIFFRDGIEEIINIQPYTAEEI